MSLPKKAVLRRKAEEDIEQIAFYIARDNITAAEQFFDAVEEMCELLVDMPKAGSIRIYENISLREVRIMPIKRFEKYMLFYRESESTVEIIRVVHGARDLPGLFH